MHKINYEFSLTLISDRGNILEKQNTERGVILWAEAEVHTAAEAIPEAGLSAGVQAAVSEAVMETEEVPAGPDLADRDSVVLHREVLDSAAPADGVQDGAAPAEDGEAGSFREAALAGEVRVEEADADVSLSFSS